MKLAIIGNCQAVPLSTLLAAQCPEVQISAVIPLVGLTVEREEEALASLEDADLIVTQLVFDSFPVPGVRTSEVEQRFAGKVTKIVNLYFTGYNPDYRHLRLPSGFLMSGPLAGYHNRSILHAYRQGWDAETAGLLLSDPDVNAEWYAGDATKSLAELGRREALADVRILDEILLKFQHEQLFYTFNHPSFRMLDLYAKRILAHLKLPGSDLMDFEAAWEPLGGVRPMINCQARQEYNISFPGTEYHWGHLIHLMHDGSIETGDFSVYDDKVLAEAFYRLYDYFPDVIEQSPAFETNVEF